jgi:hypothetical protein
MQHVNDKPETKIKFIMQFAQIEQCLQNATAYYTGGGNDV